MYHTVLSDIINTLRLTGLFNYSCIFIRTICWDILTLLWPVLSLVSFLTSHLLYSLYLCIPTPPSIIILLHSHSLPWLFPTMFGLSPLQIALSLCSPVHYGHSVSPHLSWEAVFVVQSLSHVQLFATPWTPANQASLSFTISRVCWNSCPLSQWCRPTISSSVTSFSSCPWFFPASESFPMSWLFSSGGQSIGASDLASVLPVNIQGSFPLGLIGLISLLPKRLSRVLCTTNWNSILWCSNTKGWVRFMSDWIRHQVLNPNVCSFTYRNCFSFQLYMD